MELSEYCKKTKTRQKDIAKKVRASAGFISQICNGNRRPSPEVADAIEKATNGEVTFEELLRPKAA